MEGVGWGGRGVCHSSQLQTLYMKQTAARRAFEGGRGRRSEVGGGGWRGAASGKGGETGGDGIRQEETGGGVTSTKATTLCRQGQFQR